MTEAGIVQLNLAWIALLALAEFVEKLAPPVWRVGRCLRPG